MNYSFKYQPMAGSCTLRRKAECQGTDWVTRTLASNGLIFTPPPRISFMFEGFFQAFSDINVGLAEFIWKRYHVEEQRFVYLKNLSVKYTLIIVQGREFGVL